MKKLLEKKSSSSLIVSDIRYDLILVALKIKDFICPWVQHELVRL